MNSIYKTYVCIKKELLQLVNDKVGLLIMFAMPLLLVVVITLIQDSTFKLVNDNRISMLIVNKDKGVQGGRLLNMMKESGMFSVTADSSIERSELKRVLLDRNSNVALFIPADFSKNLTDRASGIGSAFLSDLGVKDETDTKTDTSSVNIDFVHDPVLQENYCYSLMAVVSSYLQIIGNSLMVETMYQEMGYGQVPDNLKAMIGKNQVAISKTVATNADFNVMPNSTQHNVPAWTVFAMFFMVVSLGSNIVTERRNGSFIRLKSTPTGFGLVLASKMAVYLLAAILQVLLIFSVGRWLFPLINLAPLTLPPDLIGLLAVVLFSGTAAVSYALLIGTLAKTEEQANGFGAVSIIIFAALGGIWVPVFIMPGYLKALSNASPLYWCLEGFYTVFLKGGSFTSLARILFFQFGFISVCLGIVYMKLKRSLIL